MMKITKIETFRQQVELTKPFKISFRTITAVDTLIVKISTDAGLVGFGEASPIAQVTAESVDTEQVALDFFADLLVGSDPCAIEALHTKMDSALAGHTAAKAGIDIACFDLLGKQAGLPLWKLLGGNANQIVSDVTLGIESPEKAAHDAKKWVAQGFTELKLKVGVDDASDLATVKAVREAVGPDIDLRLDANQAWTAKHTIHMMAQFGDLVSAVEQPLPADDTRDLALVRANIDQQLMVDESVHSAKDALKIVADGGTDLINIKLQKSSGIWGAEQINAIAESAGVNTMLGCMLETKVGLTAAAHFVAAHKNVHFADLDGFLTFKAPAWLHGGFENDGGVFTLSDEPGLGMTIDL